MIPFEPTLYSNQFGMNEHQEEKFIHSTIEQFCNSVTKKYEESNSSLYDLLYEYIQENLEKFLPGNENE